jgi:LDH2 family malate/lactate/ureidoglycolate dehydrogenase
VTQHLPVEAMRLFASAVLKAKGASEANTAVVVDHLVDASLRGLEAHGIMRVSEYARMMDTGFIDGRAEPEITERTAGAFLVHGRNGFGHVAMLAAVDRLSQTLDDGAAMASAAVTGVAHTGRVGAYAEALAKRGCLAIVFGGGAHEKYPSVAPYGGRRGVMSTNPVAVAIPGAAGVPVSVDFATATTAGGRLRYARDNGLQLPEGHVIDNKGRPSRSAEDYFNGGAILPLAGPKGSGLGIVAELLGHALLGPTHEFNWFIIAVRLSAFGGEDYRERAEAFLARLNGIEPLEGFDRVLYPGQFEDVNRNRHQITGIPVSEAVKAELERLSTETAVPMPAFA